MAELLGFSTDMLLLRPPKDARDFAVSLLSGVYTVNEEEHAKKQLRSDLGGAILRKTSTLQRTQTRERNGEVMPDEIEFMADMFTKQDGNLQTLSRLTGCTQKLMNKDPPEDAEDFARKVLNGTNTADKTENAKKEMRDRLQWELEVKRRKLKRTTTKELTGDTTPEDIQAFSKIYTDFGGNLDRLAPIFGVSAQLMKDKPPSNARDFAKKLLSGAYTSSAPPGEAQRKELYNALMVATGQVHEPVKKVVGTIRRAPSLLPRDYAPPTHGDLAEVAKFYTNQGGNLDVMAQKMKLDVNLLKAKPPTDASDFAHLLLSGDAYAKDRGVEAKARIHGDMGSQLARTSSQLRRTQTKFGTGPSFEELEQIGQCFDEANGDMHKLALFFGIS